ncbi:MAG: hypothetical protein AAF589_04590, partial [Planctomycetota bacterium]
IFWLEDLGHREAVIEPVLGMVAEYDERTAHVSVFDSIDSGTLNLADIIREALDSEAEGGQQ